MSDREVTLEEIKTLMEAKFRSLTEGLGRMLRSSEVAAENARHAADRALELAPRIERLEEKSTDHELRLQALERGGVVDFDEDS